MSDLDDYLAYLRYERAAAAQTIATYRRLLLQFAAAFPEENLRALDAQTLKDYLLRLTKEHKYSAATLNQHRAALRDVLSYPNVETAVNHWLKEAA